MNALMLLMLFGILTPEEALSGFSNTIIMMLIGLFIIGGAVLRTGLAESVSKKTVSGGKKRNKTVFSAHYAHRRSGSFCQQRGHRRHDASHRGEPGRVNARQSPGRYLMPLAFAGTLGGMFTLIGTTPNLIINDALVRASHKGLHFFSFFPVSLICVVLDALFMGLFANRLLSKKTTPGTTRTKDIP